MKLIQNARRIWTEHRFRRKVEKALALHLRGEVRSDGLSLIRLSAHIELQWRARTIHPWDVVASASRIRSLFMAQTYSDVGAVLERLFRSFPHVHSIRLEVLDSDSDNVIMSGFVPRSAMTHGRPLSDQM